MGYGQKSSQEIGEREGRGYEWLQKNMTALGVILGGSGRKG